MAGSLDDKVAFITGGGSGIGAATAKVFARVGARVAVVVNKNLEGGQQTASEIQEAGGEALLIRADVSKEDDVRSAVQETVDHFGRLDCAFNNAGIAGESKLVVDYSRAEWDLVIAVNLTGVWLCVQEEIRQMLTTGGGAIVNMASIAGLRGNPPNAPYSASKHGVIGITKSAAKQYGSEGIRVNAVCPGGIETRMVAEVIDDPAISESLLRRQALGRFGEPGEVGEVVAFLCSDAASFVTGVAMPVDAGFVA